MAKSVETQLAELRLELKFVKAELRDVKRLEYWLLGLFVTLFVLLVASFIGLLLQ